MAEISQNFIILAAYGTAKYLRGNCLGSTAAKGLLLAFRVDLYGHSRDSPGKSFGHAQNLAAVKSDLREHLRATTR